MDERLRILLSDKKNSLQLKLHAKDFFLHHIYPFFELLDNLKVNDITVDTDYIYCPQEYIDSIINAEENVLARYNIRTDQLTPTPHKDIHRLIEEYFPSVNPLRYVPDLSNIIKIQEDPAIALQQIITGNNNFPELVYFIIPRYAPVLKIPLNIIETHAKLFFQMPEDICIFNPDHRMIICRTLEDEWFWSD